MHEPLTRTLTIILLCAILSANADEQPAQVATLTAQQIISDKHMVAGHRYISSGQPSEEVLAVVAEAGFVAVIDLRADNESRGFDEQGEVRRLGMQYYSIPVSGPEDMTYTNAKLLDDVLSGLEGPVLLHCASGNRVGALFALREKLNGASAEDALAVGISAGLTHSEAVVKSRLDDQ